MFTEGFSGIPAYLGAATTQGGVAGYGTYLIGRITRLHLAKGGTWGSLGLDTVIEEINNHLEPNTILYRIQRKVSK